MSILDRNPVALSTERVRLDLQQIGFTLAQRAEYEVIQQDHLYRELVHRLTAYILSDHLISEPFVKHYETPSTWWQHFKRDHLPTYARWRPVKTERHTVTVDFDRFATYPKANIALPALGRPVYIDRVTER